MADTEMQTLDEHTRDDVLLEVKDLRTWFPIRKGFFRTVAGHIKAVDGVNLSIRRGETLGLVGESGCGKTTLGRTALRLVQATGGQVLYRLNGQMTDVLGLDAKGLFIMRRKMQVIFQDPYSSLNPRMTVGDLVGEYLKIHGVPKRAREERIVELLQSVGLNTGYMQRYPHEFSGGQRQRIGIARALSLKPEFIVCDEPVSALDVSIQAQIINLLRGLQREMGLTYLFISHDLTVVEHLSDRVAVMYLGKIVEHGTAEGIYHKPRHPYSEALLSAIPRYRLSQAGTGSRIILQGDVPNPAHPPSGCRFHTRCQYVIEMCRQEEPPLAPVGEASDHLTACHRARELNLRGAE